MEDSYAIRDSIPLFCLFVSFVFLVGFFAMTDFMDKMSNLFVATMFDMIAMGMYLERELVRRYATKREDNIQGNDRTEGFR